MKTTNKQSGFSLIELLIVVAIIGIIAAIAIPNLLASRRAANEASAIGSMRAINSAQQTYLSTVGNNTTYAASLAALGPGTTGATPTAGAGLIDSQLAGADSATKAKSGYFFNVAQAGSDTRKFQSTGTPAAAGSSGVRQFFADETGVIRANASGAATVANDPIQ